MAGPNMEVFKFGMYVFFPIMMMVHYGDPDWYSKHVLPLKDQFVRADLPQTRPPQNNSELKDELEAMKAQRAALRQERLRQEVREASAASAGQGHDRLV